MVMINRLTWKNNSLKDEDKNVNRWKNIVCCIKTVASSGFPLGLENLEKWEGIFQSKVGEF